MTGARAIGLEIQPSLALTSRDLATRLSIPLLTTIEGDAARTPGSSALGSVFFLYCPFSGDRLTRLLASLEPIARARMLRISCVDVSLPSRPWLALERQLGPDLAIYRTTLHDEASVALLAPPDERE
jgi:hypothetical protein